MVWAAISWHSPIITFPGRITARGYVEKSGNQVHIRCSDWLQAGRPRGRSSSPRRVKNFHFSMSSKPALGSTQSPIQWVPGAPSRFFYRM
jgi:hypothetical protein